MRVRVKGVNRFLNMLYGTQKEEYNMTKKDVKIILEDHMKSLETIYDYLDDTNMAGIEQYDLGDVLNLLQEIIDKIEFE